MVNLLWSCIHLISKDTKQHYKEKYRSHFQGWKHLCLVMFIILLYRRNYEFYPTTKTKQNLLILCVYHLLAHQLNTTQHWLIQLCLVSTMLIACKNQYNKNTNIQQGIKWKNDWHAIYLHNKVRGKLIQALINKTLSKLDHKKPTLLSLIMIIPTEKEISRN